MWKTTLGSAINRFGFGGAIATKSDLVVRDIDIFKEISKHSPMLVKMTVTTADDILCGKIEPNVSVSSDFHCFETQGDVMLISRNNTKGARGYA